MLFNSLQFLVFFIIVTLLYFSIPKKLTVPLLLLASTYFYMVFKPVYILILLFTIIIDYIAGIYLEKLSGPKKSIFLLMSLIANIGVLAFFKYFNFFNHNLDVLLNRFRSGTPFPFLAILLPIGLSFHTFQAMSYTIEVYRGRQKAEKNFLVYALYVMFYPQLVAGPIERPQNMLHQFHEKHYFNYQRFKEGLLLMGTGFFKKVVIADRLSLGVDYAFAHPEHQNSLTYALAAIFYSFQIYCDFSGYSDIAIGSAKVMGFDLMQNFRSPYLSRSIPEFWTRWHISLSTWFRDYLYIPLGGNRVKTERFYFNIFLVFLLSGLWHGANWTFVVWGMIHAFYMIATNVKDKALKKWNIAVPKNKLTGLINVTVTFLLVTIAWIFFRASSWSQALEIIRTIFSFSAAGPARFGLNGAETVFSVLLIIGLLLREYYHPRIRIRSEWAFYARFILLIFSCYLFGVFRQVQFIYFQF
jgi:alginate O-acetyltransferase complex protein AlgI